MGTIVGIIEDIDIEKFKDKMEVELRNLHADGIKTDVKFSTCMKDGSNTIIVYTAMIIGSN